MDRKYFLKSPFQVAKTARIVAKTVDSLLILILVYSLYPFGALLAFIYGTVSDSLGTGQSLGKRLIGLAVISLEDGTPCNLKQSFVRNLPFLIPVFFCLFPVWGWILAAIIGLPFLGLELYLIYKLDSGHRLGDVMADTTVVAGDGQTSPLKKRSMSWFEGEAPTETGGAP